MDNIALLSVNSLLTVIVLAVILQDVKLILLSVVISILLIRFEDPKLKPGPYIKS